MSESSTNATSNVMKLVECGAMVAIATVLSMVKLIDLPYGGSVTIASMLPIVIISYRHGTKWGVMTGVVFAILQQLLGMNTLSYVSTWQSILAVIFLDYIIAFTVTGFGGIFRGKLSQPNALMAGSIYVCVLRYICHVISGATVWAGLSIPTNAALIYSFGYNATYMIPETIVTATLGYFVGTVLDFGNETIAPFHKEKTITGVSVLRLIGGITLTVVLIFDAVSVFSHLQNGDTGEFDITGLSSVNWTPVLLITVTAVLASYILFTVSKKHVVTSHE